MSLSNRKNRIKYSYRNKLLQGVIYVYVTLSALFSFIPLFITVVNSLKDQSSIMKNVFGLPSLSTMFIEAGLNYLEAWTAVGASFFQTIIVSIIGGFFVVLLGALLAYILVFKDFYFKNFVFMLFISVLLIPSIIGFPVLVPLIKNTFHLADTYFGYLLPTIGGAQVGGMFLFRTFFSQQPKSIYESAKLDGASDMTIILNITFPLGLPILLYHFITIFSSIYNDYTWSNLILSDKMTLMPILYSKIATGLSYGGKYAAYIIASIPLIFTSILSMKYFSSGEFASGMKL